MLSLYCGAIIVLIRLSACDASDLSITAALACTTPTKIEPFAVDCEVALSQKKDFELTFIANF